jgi:Ca2+-binding EF-hand superfamily protein
MKLAQSLFFIVGAALALAVGAVRAEDKVGKDANDPGFNALDKDNDGYISRSEAAGNPNLAKKFKEADKNGDGKLSRAEYLWAMTKQDASTAANKTKNAATGASNKAQNAVDRNSPKGDDVGKDANDPGFHALDKDKDGSISKAEAAANPALAGKFAEADKNHDGKLSRAEYLWAMTKQDAATATKKTENAIKKDDKPAASGSTTSK